MMLPVAILAGGLATRLRPVTSHIPKAMVDVAGRPFIAWQLDYLCQQGVTHVTLCAGYLGEQIEAFVGDGKAFGLHVDYSFDGPTLLGTGGALKRALPKLGDAFFVFYGDSYLPINFLQVADDFKRQAKSALMTVVKNNNQWDKSNVLFGKGVLLEYNKHHPRVEMAYVDYGLGVMSASVFAPYPDSEPFDLADVYHQLSIEGNLAGYEVFERFYEIGSHQGLQETIDHLEKELY
jgi:MurNAc alpha-1-phosphate uridylyltransferase